MRNLKDGVGKAAGGACFSLADQLFLLLVGSRSGAQL